MKKTVISILLVLTLLSLGVFFLKDVLTPEDSPTTEERILSTIVEGAPQFSNNGVPVIEIYSVSSPEDGWYIATVKSTHSVDNFVPVKFILSKNGDKLRLIDGPDAYFSEDRMLSRNVPDSVILELKKS